jgi:hypothetical protein
MRGNYEYRGRRRIALRIGYVRLAVFYLWPIAFEIYGYYKLFRTPDYKWLLIISAVVSAYLLIAAIILLLSGPDFS